MAANGKRSQDSIDGIKRRGRIWYEDFSVRGCPRFRGCLGTDNRDTAKTIVAAKKSALLLGNYTQAKPEVTLDDAIGRHWMEQQQYWGSARSAVTWNRTLLRHLGKATLLHTLTFGTVSAYVATRRATVENRSVNRELTHLQQIINSCEAWGYRVPDPALPFRSRRGPQLCLPEPDKRPVPLAPTQEEELFARMPVDFHPVMRFALLTGVRRENAFLLRWDQIKEIDSEAGWIDLRVKSKKPGRKVFRIDLTPALKALLSRERGNDETYVFTYVCRHGQRRPDGTWLIAGQRYPLLYRGGNFQRLWKRAKLAIGMPELRFHDLRHTFATKLARIAPLPVVQQAMGHADIRTTMIYEHTNQEAVLAWRLQLEAAEGALRVIGDDRRIMTGTSANAPLNESLTKPEQDHAQGLHKVASES